ncbi:MAG: TonB-dependent receptor, partial [Candidatus Sericytochromatia bacterium]
DNFEISSGRHNITIGTHNEFSFAKNVFFGNNFGSYRFSRYSDFASYLDNDISNDIRPNRFRLGYSLVGGEGDDSQGAAEFNVAQFGFYVQDEFRVVDNFKLTFGIRGDVPVWDNYIENNDFNTRTVALLEAQGKDLRDARIGQSIRNQLHLSPRLGFNYDVNGNKKTQIRGGVGVFTSRLPLVWPGGAYNNNGVTTGFVEITTTSANSANMPNFNPNPSVGSQIINQNGAQLAPLPGNPGAPGQFGGNIDLFDRNFKLPQVFKASLAVDQKLPYGILFSGDITYNDNISSVKYENLNLAEPTEFLTGADRRPRYNRNRIDPTYEGIYLATNTSEGKA